MNTIIRRKLAARMRAMSRAERIQYLANLRVIWAWRRKMERWQQWTPTTRQEAA